MDTPMTRNQQHVSQIFSISSKYWKERLQNIEVEDNNAGSKRRILIVQEDAETQARVLRIFFRGQKNY